MGSNPTMHTKIMFESTVPEKFKGLKCAKCETELAVGARCRVQTDVSGWLLYAECIECPKSFAPVAQMD